MPRKIKESDKIKIQIENNIVETVSQVASQSVRNFILEMYSRGMDFTEIWSQIEMIIMDSMYHTFVEIEKIRGFSQENLEIIKQGIKFYTKQKEEQ